MKKILLAAAFCAVASLNSFGAACANDTIANLALAGSCTIGAWTLDTWGLGATPSQTGYSSNPTTADVFVSFQSLVNGAGAAGFRVTFSDAAGGNNFFNAVSGIPNQSADFRTLFVITGTAIANVASLVTGATTTAGNNGSILLQKIVSDPNAPGNPVLGNGNILTVSNFQSSNPITIYNNQANASNKMGVIDNYQISSGNNGVSTLTSYSNTFFQADPTGVIPEPMTFVLMGAGLVGIAALRRRNR
ncbi:MAG: PEP-CTERM sorting domain-containing protein [Bryobacteraceae bacterium]